MIRIILILTVSLMCLFSQDDILFKQWEVKKYPEQNNMIIYKTHGTVIWGHEFGFVKYPGKCDDNELWMTWSSYEKDVQRITRKNVYFRMTIDSYVTYTFFPARYVTQFTPTMSIVFFNGIKMRKDFIDILKKARKIEFEIVGEDYVMSKMDITEEIFDLNGFTASSVKAKEMCLIESLPKI